MSNRQASTVTALSRGLSILRCFDRPRIELTVSEIAREVRLSQPTTWRLCQTLIDAGFLVKSPKGAALRVGAPALTLGYVAIRGMDFRELALPHMRTLTERTHATTTLSVLQGAEIISLDKVEGEFVRPGEPAGWRAPITSIASGLAILARMTAVERDAAVALLPPDQRHEDRIADACRQFETSGVVELTGMLNGHYGAIAVPLWAGPDRAGQYYSLSCGGLMAAWAEEHRALARDVLRETAAMLEPALMATA